MSNADYINILHKRLHIMAISEHWLHYYELNRLGNLNRNFRFHSLSSATEEDPVFCRPRNIRGHGGVDKCVTKLTLPNTHRVIGIQLLSLPRPTCFLSVYLPSRSGCTDDFKEALDYIDAVINTYGFDNDIVILDMNADIDSSAEPTTSPSEQGCILSAYLARCNITYQFTYVSLYMLTRM